MSKRFLLVLVGIVLGLGLIFFVSKDSSEIDTGGAQPSQHVFGDGTKGVTLVEYGDFQCPYCGDYYPIIKQLKETFKSEITFQFRHFPLPSHQNAFAAHRAAQAASKQGKFWEMHDTLYEQQDSWESSPNPYPLFESFAQVIGLNMDQYKSDYESSETNSIINADKKAGQDLDVGATPTFILDGKKLDPSPTDFDSFKTLIEETIKQKAGN